MESFRSWWERNRQEFKALMFDIDGTLISAGKLLPGAEEFLAHLRESAFPFCLLTNDGNHSTEEKSVLMAAAGLHVSPDEIVSCSMALEEYAEEHRCKGKSFFIMGDLGDPCYALRAGLLPCRDIRGIEACDGVIVGEGSYNWQDNIHAVFNYLVRHPEKPLIVPNPDSYWPGRVKGEYGIGAGAKARFICGLLNEMGIAKEPLYFGKPYAKIYEYALHRMTARFKLDPMPQMPEILMIGDSLSSDIRGANRLGIRSLLVLTGITSAAQAAEAKGELRPALVFADLS